MAVATPNRGIIIKYIEGVILKSIERKNRTHRGSIAPQTLKKGGLALAVGKKFFALLIQKLGGKDASLIPSGLPSRQQDKGKRFQRSFLSATEDDG